MLEDGVAVAVANDVRRADVFANRQRGRSPQLAGVEVADVEHLAGAVAHRIVRPLRNLMLLAVDGPGVAGAFDRNREAERRICNNVDPWRGRPLPFAENRHVLAAVRGKSAEPVEGFEIAPRRRGRRSLYRGSSPRWRALGRLKHLEPFDLLG